MPSIADFYAGSLPLSEFRPLYEVLCRYFLPLVRQAIARQFPHEDEHLREDAVEEAWLWLQAWPEGYIGNKSFFGYLERQARGRLANGIRKRRLRARREMSFAPEEFENFPEFFATNGRAANRDDCYLIETQRAQLARLVELLPEEEAGTSDNPVTVANFTDSYTGSSAGDFTASVNWGDGTTSTGAVSGSGGSYSVKANHAYVTPGAYTITTTITDDGGSTVNATGTATIGVIAGQEYDAVLSISLPDAVTTSPPSAYNASITWGDGTSSSATATPVYSYSGGTLSGSLLVTATHVYSAEGSYTVSASATNQTRATPRPVPNP